MTGNEELTTPRPDPLARSMLAPAFSPRYTNLPDGPRTYAACSCLLVEHGDRITVALGVCHRWDTGLASALARAIGEGGQR